MPKFITALLTYFIQYKKLALGGRNYVEKTVLSCLDKHYWVQSKKYFSLLSSQLVYRNKVVKVINADRFPEKRPPTSRQIFKDFQWLLLKLETGQVLMKAL